MSNELFKRIFSSIILLPVTFFIIIKGSYLFNFFILICFFLTAHEWHIMSKKKPFYISGFIFLVFSFYSIYHLRNDFGGDYIYFLIITLICISTDIGGYTFGKIIKGPKLTKISPKKTYSGMIGGYLLSIVFLSIFFNSSYFFANKLDLSLKWLIFIFAVSTISQLGDIVISYFKRLTNIKDTGKIIPGHGGLLDRIDGMIFAYPFSYIILVLNFF
tara:strand:- start:356 stop:1003 length:648 start_codon:yes stop_codon:yes gene_type:complete